MNIKNHDYELVHITDIQGIQGNIEDFGKYSQYIQYLEITDNIFPHNSSSIITPNIAFSLYQGKNKERARYGIILNKDNITVKQIFAQGIGSNGMLAQKQSTGKYKFGSSTIEQDAYTDVHIFINSQKNKNKLEINEVLSCAKNKDCVNKCVKALLFNETDCTQLPNDIEQFKSIIKEKKLPLIRYDMNNSKNRYSTIPDNKIDDYFSAINENRLYTFLNQLQNEESEKKFKEYIENIEIQR